MRGDVTQNTAFHSHSVRKERTDTSVLDALPLEFFEVLPIDRSAALA